MGVIFDPPRIFKTLYTNFYQKKKKDPLQIPLTIGLRIQLTHIYKCDLVQNYKNTLKPRIPLSFFLENEKK